MNPPDWLPATLAAHALEIRLAKGESLFRTSDAVTRFHFVAAGELAAIRAMPNGAEAVMLTARAGEFFAEASLFLPRYTCDARAVSACRIIAWPSETFRSAIFAEPAAALAFSRMLAVNLRRQCSRVERLRMKNADDRILHYLACETAPNGWVEVTSSLQEWAAELGLEPETVYRALSRLEAAGMLERDRRRLRLVGSQVASCTRPE
jgi:CRP-like cAMP-binding protein